MNNFSVSRLSLNLILNEFKEGKRSPYVTKDEYIAKAVETWHDEQGKPLYDYSNSDYKGTHRPITINCPKKGHGDFLVPAAGNHLDHSGRPGQGCPICKCEEKKETFIAKAKAVHGDTYGYDKVDFCDKKNMRRDKTSGQPRWYFDIYCKKDQGYFPQRTDIHLAGHGCPVCLESKGEKIMSDYLSSLGYKMGPKNFEDCTNEKKGKDCRRLRYDANVPELNMLFEYDGKQHFSDVEYFKKKGWTYENQVSNDRLKNAYCMKEGKPKLIRISYKTPFNKIPSVLDELIKKAKATDDKIILAKDYPQEGWNS